MKDVKEASEQLHQIWRKPSGFWGWFSVVNNRLLGVRFMVTAFAFFLIGGVLALLMRIQLTVPENTFLSPQTYNELFTMHGSTMMFLFAVPMLEGLAVYFLPIMLGSRDLAFPRLSAFGYWTYLFGGLVFYASFFVGDVPNAGWFAYTPLSASRYSGMGMDFWALGLSLVELSGIVAAVEIVVTVLKFRAPGMTLGRMPIFAWTMLAVGVMSLFAFTTLLVATLLLELDRTAGTQFFNPNRGGSNLLWQHLFWFFGHPEVYIIFLPATGIVSTIVGTYSRRLLGYTIITVAILVTAFVSFGLWAHHMYTTGLPELSLSFFAAASLMIALASGAQVFAWIASLWGRRPSLEPPLMFILGFLVIFVMGGMTGVMIAIVPFDWQVHDTYFIVAHFHYVLIGGAVFPLMGGLYYWIPKITGRMLNPLLGHASFWAAFVGFHATFFPMHLMGFWGMPRRVYTFPESLGIEGHNVLATIGAFVFGFAFLIFLFDLLVSLLVGERAGENPWNGDTLEWSISSPPPSYMFLAPPVVRGRHPCWHREPKGSEGDLAERASEVLWGQPTAWRGNLITEAVNATPQGIQYLPGPSYRPLLVSLGLLIAFLAVLTKLFLVTLVAAVFALGVLAKWLWPDRHVIAMLRSSELGRREGLPILVTGSRSTVWWGTICLLTILATALAALTYAYFYIRLYASEWPQTGLDPPALLGPAITYGTLLVSGAGLFWANRAFRGGKANAIQFAFTLVVLSGAAFLALAVYGLVQLPFSHRDHAYGSLFYLHSIFISLLTLAGLALVGSAQIRVWSEHEDREGSMKLQMQVTSLLWYFVVVAGVCTFTTLYLSPYVL
ncbi:cytochrome c oxidase subunit I [Candidatus Laterigemmans baculatus]|uniref:cytochrome c oxidase subunit I n=1 Tax=Candidatus Laterigemmans baculatus TaxID=2770505 RepID=UPI0013D95B79|nr:cytochrome c oxidase subunit I [Candidatus Laterigemmans baculatus]